MSKPTIQLSGQDGNVFNLIGIASRALKKDGQRAKAEEMATKCMSGDYDNAIQTIMDYCEVQ